MGLLSSGLFSSSSKKVFPWIQLESISLLEEALASDSIVVLFKHSTTCSISKMAFSRFERQFIPTEEVDLYYLDLLNFRPISAKIAELTKVEHQSPQIIALKNGKIIYTATHNGIDAKELMESIAAL
jgi:bacillithiol system protein YtxJ